MQITLPGLLLCGAFFTANAVDAKVHVVATVPDLAALAMAVGGSEVEVATLARPADDPRRVAAGPSQVVTLHRADLLIAVGLALEVGWLPALQTAARNTRITAAGDRFLDCSDFVTATAAAGRARSPHYLLDPHHAGTCARAIGGALAALDPDHAPRYAANVAQLVGELDAAIERWQRAAAGLAGRRVVVYDRGWSAAIGWLGLDAVAALAPAPDVAPTSRDVEAAVAIARAAGATVVLQAAFHPDPIGRCVADQLAGRVVVVPGGTDVDAGETYVDHIGHVVDTIVAACG